MKNAVLNYSVTTQKEMEKVNKAFKLNNRIFIGAIVFATFIYALLSISIV